MASKFLAIIYLLNSIKLVVSANNNDTNNNNDEVLMASSNSTSDDEAPKRSARDIHADVILSNIFALGSENGLQSNSPTFKIYCRKQTDYCKMMTKYVNKRWKHQLVRKVSDMLSNSIQKTNVALCKSHQKSEQYIATALAVNQKNEEIAKIRDKWIEKMLALQDTVNGDYEKINKHFCCGLRQTKIDIMKTVDEYSEDNKKFLSGLLNGYFLEMTQYFCGLYLPYETKCANVTFPEFKNNYEKPKSWFMPLFELFSKAVLDF